MELELREVRDFVAGVRPFNGLPEDELLWLVRRLQIKYVRRGTLVLAPAQKNDFFYLIRSGAVELFSEDDTFVAQLSEGDCFAFPSLLRDGISRSRVTCIEDSLFYLLPAGDFRALYGRHPDVEHYFGTAEANRLREALRNFQLEHLEPDHIQLVTVPLSDLFRRGEPVTAPADETVQGAARRMHSADVSTVLVIDEARQLVGIVTDQDMRNRVLAAGRAPDTALRQIMTPEPLSLPPTAHAFEALLIMTQRNIHHVVVVDAERRPLGVVGAHDILSRISANALYLAARLDSAHNAAEVAATTRSIPRSLAALTETGMPAHTVGYFISSVGEAAHRRLAQLAEAQLGPPPVPYALLVFGSLARGDQTGISDQDNGLLISDEYDPTAHSAYFEALAGFLCDGLNEAGYAYCRGDIMATNPRWRQSLAGWKHTFEQWIECPDPKAVMHTTIFYDLRAIHGDRALAAALQQHVLHLAQANRIFLAHLAGDAMHAQVPLGFFRQFVLTKDRQRGGVLDLKKQGMAPVIDIARVHALAHAISAVNTRARLDALAEVGALAESDAHDLRDALDFIAHVRLRHQARQARSGVPLDNQIAPAELSPFERDHLKDAFSLVRTHQTGLASAYRGGLSG